MHREEEKVMNPWADIGAGLTTLGKGVRVPTLARSLEVGKTRVRRALSLPILSSHCPVLQGGCCATLLLHPAAPSRLAWPPCWSRLLWQVAGLADGNDHILGLAVPTPWHLRHLVHLVDTVADAVDVALVAVVIRAGAKDPVWRREKAQNQLLITSGCSQRQS